MSGSPAAGSSKELPLLAWAGWWLPLPSSWALLKVEGNHNRGLIGLGDGERPRLEVTWAWVTRRSLKVEHFAKHFLLSQIRRRDRKRAAEQMQKLSLPHLDPVFLIKEENLTRAVAYSSVNHRFIHWIYHHGRSGENRRFFAEAVPQWKDQSLRAPVVWRFFDIQFSSPPGFRLKSSQLNLGDMDVRLTDPTRWGTRHRLCVRHVYPASLALSRQPAHHWLTELFKTSRGPYRARWGSMPDRASATGPRLEARLQFLLRYFLRLLIFRIPGCAEATLHHLTETNKLLYLQIGAPKSKFAPIRESILRSIPAPVSHGQNHP